MRPATYSGSRKQHGFALILVLWVLSLMIIMAGSFALSMRREAGLVSNIRNTAQALAIAESGVNIAEMMLLLPDALKRWHTDGSIYQVDMDEAVIRIKLLSENGKIDINKADEKILKALLLAVPSLDEKAQSKLLGAIMDWRDTDDLLHIDGAEKKEYQDAGLRYGPRNKPFRSIDELRLVLGFDEDIFQWMSPLITVYGTAKVNQQMASVDVLRVLPDLDEELIDEFVAARLDSARKDLPVPAFPSAITPLVPIKNAPQVQNTQATANNQVITVISEVLLDDGTSASLTAVVQNVSGSKTPFQLFNWQRNVVSHQSLFAESETDTTAESDLPVKHYAESEFFH